MCSADHAACEIRNERDVPNSRSGREDADTLYVLALFSFGWALLLSLFKGLNGNQGKYATVTIQICQCVDCSKRSTIEPLKVDHDRGVMRLLVHRDFARYFEDANAATEEARS